MKKELTHTRANELLRYERANELLRYDPESGGLFWKVSRGPAKPGDEAGCVHVDERNLYRMIMVDGRKYMAHRIVWLLHHRRCPEQYIDHINGNGLDNRIENLRDVSVSVNMRNAKMYCTNTSGVTGVHWRKDRGKWQARVQAEGKFNHLGLFETIEEAEMAVKNFRALHNFTERHGEATCLLCV